MYVRSSFTVVKLQDLWSNYPVVYGTWPSVRKVGANWEQVQILGAWPLYLPLETPLCGACEEVLTPFCL